MFSTLVTSAAHALAAGDVITGISSGAIAHVNSSSAGTTLNVTNSIGSFQVGETVRISSTDSVSVFTLTDVTNHTFDSVKQLHTPYIDGRTFTADTRLQSSFVLSGLISATGSNCTGFNTSFLTELKVGDVISIPSASGGSVEQRVVVSIADNSTLVLNSPVTNNVTAVGVSRLRVEIIDQNKNILVLEAAMNLNEIPIWIVSEMFDR
jgi:hypothetical protein